MCLSILTTSQPLFLLPSRTLNLLTVHKDCRSSTISSLKSNPIFSSSLKRNSERMDNLGMDRMALTCIRLDTKRRRFYGQREEEKSLWSFLNTFISRSCCLIRPFLLIMSLLNSVTQWSMFVVVNWIFSVCSDLHQAVVTICPIHCLSLSLLKF